MNHLSPTNAPPVVNSNNSMLTPSAVGNGSRHAAMQSLTIETSNVHQQHPSQILSQGAVSPQNAANNPQLRYKNESNALGFNQGAVIGIHHPASTKN